MWLSSEKMTGTPFARAALTIETQAPIGSANASGMGSVPPSTSMTRIAVEERSISFEVCQVVC